MLKDKTPHKGEYLSVITLLFFSFIGGWKCHCDKQRYNQMRNSIGAKHPHVMKQLKSKARFVILQVTIVNFVKECNLVTGKSVCLGKATLVFFLSKFGSGLKYKKVFLNEEIS